jgi:hypothetical protein
VIAILEYILGLFTQKLGLQKEQPMNTYYAAIVNHPNQKLDPDNNIPLIQIFTAPPNAITG